MPSLPVSPSAADPFGSPVVAVPFEQFREHVLNLYKPPIRSRTTFLSVRRSLDLLVELGGVETTADLTTATVARFVQWRAGKENPNTTRTHLRKLSATFSIGVGEGWIRVNPFSIRRLWLRGVSPKRPRVHSLEELARVLALARAEIDQVHPAERWKARRLYALLATAAYTGMRKTEVLTLRVEDIDLKSQLILLTSRADNTFKTDESAQPVPMPFELVPILRGWLRHVDRSEYVFPGATLAKPWVGGVEGKRACDALQALGLRAGFPGLTFQSLRHSWATHAEVWGLTSVQIQRIMRHTTTGTQNFYRHPELNNLREMVRGVSFNGTPAEIPAPPSGAPEPGAGRMGEIAARVADLRLAPAPALSPAIDPVMIEYRGIPGFPRHRLGSDRSVWTNTRRDGHERPGDAPGAWRRLTATSAGKVVNLRHDGRTCQRTMVALMREVFGIDS